MQIGAQEIQASYGVAKNVFENFLGKEAGAKQLQAQLGMNLGSARDYIKTFRCLMNGLVFTRTLNAPAAEYYLANIFSDFGPAQLRNAIASMKLHIVYYEGKSKSTIRSLRAIVAKYESKAKGIDLDVYEAEFQASVALALKDSAATRKNRLNSATETPKKIQVPVDYFLRNRDVVAEVLIRAAGVCELCKRAAPFIRKSDQTPYLEVHHKVQLAQGGKDIVANAIALCPNCHRKSHYGQEDA